MAGSVNKVILVGNLGKDPEIRHMPDGGRVATFSVATSETWKDRTTGERKEKTEWHRIVVFNEHLADIVEKYVKKGSKVYLEGQLQTRKWVDAGGQEKYATEVLLSKFKGELSLLDSRGSAEGAGSKSFSEGAFGKDATKELKVAEALDDEIPF